MLRVGLQGKKCCWGLWVNVGLVKEGGGNSFYPPSRYATVPAVNTHCTGDQRGFVPGLGTPAAVMGRWALHLHRVVAGGVGSDRSFGTTGLAAVDGPELLLIAVGHCPAWHLTSCPLPALGLCQWPGESHPLPHLALTSIQHQPARLCFHCSPEHLFIALISKVWKLLLQ